ncbi:RnfH family protein [Chitinimonas sp.]|uniref:RnfH family protein n=1 Tax=Chitinimonas sp. TaxID=1934313 RepID=UPI0035B33D28
MLTIEVVYASASAQQLVKLALAEGCTAGEAITRSGLLARFPEIDLAQQRIGIFSRLCTRDTRLRDGDRVEIYRPLLADPKESRRERVAAVRARTGKLK